MSKWICAALVLFAGTALAQDPGADEEEFDLKAAIRKVTKLMRESEKSLVEALGKKDGENNTGEVGENARKALDDLLREGRDKGKEAADLLQEIIEKAPVSQGQGQGQEQQKPSDSEEQKRREQEQKAEDRDPQNSGSKDPKDGESKDEPQDTAKPPPSDSDEPTAPDPAKEWLGRLPDQIKQAVMNGEYDKIPARFRELLQKYFKKVAEVESDK